MVTLDELKSTEPGAITDGPFGSKLTSAHYSQEGARVVRLQNIGSGIFKPGNAFIPWDHFETLRKHEVRSGDLLIASLGDDPPRACLAPDALGPAIVKADCIRVRLSPGVHPRWVMYAMQTPALKRWAAEQLHGVGRPRLGLKTIRQLPIPLPPPTDQRRIIDLLEDHLSRLDAGTDLLEKAAIRASYWEAVLSAETLYGETELLGAVAEVQGGIQKQSKRAPRDNPYPFLRVANVTASGLDLSDVHQVELFDGEIDRFRLQRGDLLVVEGNGSPSQIGRAALWDGSINDCVHQNHLIRVRPRSGVLPEYLEIAWNAPQTRRGLTRLASSSSGLYTLSVSKLKRVELRIPALDVQRGVIARVHEAREARTRMQVALRQAGAHATALRRALLDAAFFGRLTGRSVDAETVEELAAQRADELPVPVG